MRRSGWHWLSLASLTFVACDGREVPVFELPAHVGGVAGSSAGTSTSAGANSNSAGSSAGTDSAPAGSSSAGTGGSGGGGRGPTTDGGSAGSYGNGAGMPGSAGSASCSDAEPCQLGWTCERQGCDAPNGVCVPWPPDCFPNYNPVCGCDGVTYWNDCIRLRSGARLAGSDICRASACTCEVGADCNVPYASCSHLLPPGAMCGHGEGACWVLPPVCPPPPVGAKLWLECKPPDQGGQGGCLDMCSAIATEHSYAELHRGEVCQ